MCDTLQALGATDVQLGLVGVGSVDPMQLLDELTGNAAAPVVPASSTTDIVLGGIGATGEAISQGASNVASTITGGLSGIASWFSSHWIWLVAGIIAVLLLAVWAFGGFKLGFLGG